MLQRRRRHRACGANLITGSRDPQDDRPAWRRPRSPPAVDRDVPVERRWAVFGARTSCPRGLQSRLLGEPTYGKNRADFDVVNNLSAMLGFTACRGRVRTLVRHLAREQGFAPRHRKIGTYTLPASGAATWNDRKSGARRRERWRRECHNEVTPFEAGKALQESNLRFSSLVCAMVLLGNRDSGVTESRPWIRESDIKACPRTREIREIRLAGDGEFEWSKWWYRLLELLGSHPSWFTGNLHPKTL